MNARGARTRARLIQATIDVVAEAGYARATTKTIADAAGVAEGTIYRHFPDKRQLFFAAVLDRNTAVLNWIAALPQRAGTGTVAGNLREALEQLGRLRADLIPLELWLRSDPEHSKDLATAMIDLGKNGPLMAVDNAAGSPVGGSPVGNSPVGNSPGGLSEGALPGSPSGVPPRDGQQGGVGELPGPPQFVAKYLEAERDLGRIRPATDPERVAVLLLLILFGIAMTPAADGRGLDDSLIAFAVDTVMDGIGVESTSVESTSVESTGAEGTGPAA